MPRTRRRSSKKLLYVSNGNVPSRWTNSVQAVKMGEALAGLVPHFEMWAAGGRLRSGPSKRTIWSWYDVRRPFALRRIPLTWWPQPVGPERSRPRGYADAVFQQLERARPHLVMTRSVEIARSCLTIDLPVVLEYHGEPSAGAARRLREIAHQRALRGVVTTWERPASRYAALGVPGDRIYVWPHACDPPGRWCGLPLEAREAARAGLPVERDRPLAVFAGHLGVGKGADLLVDVARSLPQVQFAVAGGWAAQARSAADPAPENVTWLGFLHRRVLARWLAAADACLVTTSRGADRASQRHFDWTMPLRLSDYLAARRPILTTDLPSLSGMNIDDSCARIVPQGDVAAFADALCELIADAEEARRLADGAWARACAYTWSDRARDVLEALAPELWGSWAA